MKLLSVRFIPLLVLPLLFYSCAKKETVALVTQIVVDYVEGDVLIDGEVAVAGQKLDAKFTVQTGEASYCAVIFDAKNIMHIDAETVASVDLGQAVKQVTLERGIIASAFRKLDQVAGSDGDGFRLTTPTAVAGVRGTVFFVKAESEESSYVCACNGVLHISDDDGDNDRLVESAHHAAFRYVQEGDGVASSVAPLLFHTDEMMELGAARIGETIDWTTVGP